MTQITDLVVKTGGFYDRKTHGNDRGKGNPRTIEIWKQKIS